MNNINPIEVSTLNEGEVLVDLRKLAQILKKYKWLIFCFTGLPTLISILYLSSIEPLPQQPPIYTVTTSVLKPSANSILNINRFGNLDYTDESVFSKFLTQVSSKKLQQEILIERGYKELNIPKILASFKMTTKSNPNQDPNLNSNKFLSITKFEAPYSLSINGRNPELLSVFLSELVIKSNNHIISNIKNLIQSKINNRLFAISNKEVSLINITKQERLSQIQRIKEEVALKAREIKEEGALKAREIKEEGALKAREINNQINFLRLNAKNQRLSQIQRIKEEDAQKVRDINDRIKRLEDSEDTIRLNLINKLTGSAKIATSLGIIENNFKQFYQEEMIKSLIVVNSLEKNNAFPDWYLYGEKALLAEIDILKNKKKFDNSSLELVRLKEELHQANNNNLLTTLENRQNDDPFIPGLMELLSQKNDFDNNSLIEGSNLLVTNNLLVTLEMRKDDRPFTEGLGLLEIEKSKLESNLISLDSLEFSSMQVSQTPSVERMPSAPQPSTNSFLLVLSTLIGSLIVSIFLALIVNLFRTPDEKVN